MKINKTNEWTLKLRTRKLLKDKIWYDIEAYIGEELIKYFNRNNTGCFVNYFGKRFNNTLEKLKLVEEIKISRENEYTLDLFHYKINEKTFNTIRVLSERSSIENQMFNSDDKVLFNKITGEDWDDIIIKLEEEWLNKTLIKNEFYSQKNSKEINRIWREEREKEIEDLRKKEENNE